MCRYIFALLFTCCVTGVSASNSESIFLESLGKGMAQNIHNADSTTSDANLASIRKYFTQTGWRSLQTTLRKSGSNTLMHKHALSQTIDINRPTKIEPVEGAESTWLVSVEGDVMFNNASLQIQQHVVDVFVVEKHGVKYEVTTFNQFI